MDPYLLIPETKCDLPFTKSNDSTNRFHAVNSFDDLIRAVSKGYVIPTNASPDLVAMFAKDTKAAASSFAPSTDKKYFAFGGKYRIW